MPCLLIAEIDYVNLAIAFFTALAALSPVVAGLVHWNLKQRDQIAANTVTIEQAKKDIHSLRNDLQARTASDKSDDNRFHELSQTMNTWFARIDESMKGVARESTEAWKRIDIQAGQMSDLQTRFAKIEARLDFVVMGHNQPPHVGS